MQTLGEQGREVATWVSFYREERKMLMAAAQIALKNNIAERQVQLAEEQGRLTAHVIQAVLGDPELGLTAEQKVTSRKVAQRHLMLVSGVPA
jgi:TorA maturation chaperone TorD